MQTSTTGVRPAKNVRPNPTKQPILVLGGNGKTGHRVVKQLTQLDWPVRVGSRSGEPPFDWLDTRTWKPCVEGMHTIYITFQPDLAVPGAPDAIRFFTKTALEAGVKKLVLLSGRGEHEAQVCEQIVMNAGADWTILRASWFCQNFSEGFFRDQIMAGHLALPAGDVPEPFIDIDDIADVAVAALTEEGHEGKLYELTGPRMLTFREAAEEIGKAIGRPITYEQIPASEYTTMLRSYEVPEDLIELVNYLFTEVLDGRNASVADGTLQALNRPATDFKEYIRKTVASGAWD